MKIAFIGTKGIPATHGGIEKYVEELSIRLAKRGHQITVFNRSSYSDYEGDYRRVRVIKIFTPKNKYINMAYHTFLCTMKLLLTKEHFDVIHIHGADMSILALLAKLKARVVVTSHGRVYRNVSTVPGSLRVLSRFAELCYLRWPHARIAVSKALADYYDAKKTLYIPVGIDFNNRTDQGKDISDFDLRRKGYILFVGRLIPTKKVDLLIDAYKRISTAKKLVIVGDAPYGNDPYSDDLKKNTSEKIRFLGFQYGASLLSLYKNCAFFVLPSENEGLPVTLLEALSCRCLVLASDILANTEALHGYGTTFRNGSLFDLCEKMTQLLNNPQSASNSSISAVQYVRSNYNWDVIVTKHENLYNSLVRK